MRKAVIRLTLLGVGPMNSLPFAPAGLLVEFGKHRIMPDGGPEGKLLSRRKGGSDPLFPPAMGAPRVEKGSAPAKTVRLLVSQCQTEHSDIHLQTVRALHHESHLSPVCRARFAPGLLISLPPDEECGQDEHEAQGEEPERPDGRAEHREQLLCRSSACFCFRSSSCFS